MRSRSQRLAEIAAGAAEGFVVLELKESYGLGFVASPSCIVSTLHVVSDEASISAHLSSGGVVEVKSAAGVDARRDLAVLLAPKLDVRPLPLADGALVEEGARALTFSLSKDRTRTQWVDLRISGIQVLNELLTVYRLEGEFPPDISGAPLVSATGKALGVVTLAQGDEGPVVLGVPSRYLRPLLVQPTAHPLSLLSVPKKVRRRRLVPQHPMALLDGSSAKSLEYVGTVLTGAINVGAPAWQRGDVATCWQLYSETAERLVRDRHDCPGPMKALQEGLSRARSFEDLESRVRAMRDSFDALLMLIEKFSRARFAVARGAGRKSSKLLN